MYPVFEKRNMSEWGRIRFAPNTSGRLHLGNARTALVAYLYARGKGYKFDLRFDDDPVHRVPRDPEGVRGPEFEKGERENQMDQELRWLGLEWDRGYRLSERLGLAQWVIDTLEIESFDSVIQPYSTMRDVFLHRPNESTLPSAFVSFVDDVLTGTVEHVRGTDLRPLEKLEKALRVQAGSNLGFPWDYVPKYRYAAILGPSEGKWHKSGGAGVTLRGCMEAGIDPVTLQRYLLGTLAGDPDQFDQASKPTMIQAVVKDDFWKSAVSYEHTCWDPEEFEELFGRWVRDV